MAGERKAALDRRRAEERKIGESMDFLLTNEHGQRIVAYLHHICGWAQADMPVDGLGRVNTDALQHNATRRSIYGKLRSLATRSLLMPVEEAAELSEIGQRVDEEGTSQQEKK